MKAIPEAVILWPGVSGSTLGHYRDLSVVLPNFPRDARVFAVVHWGNFHELFERPSTRMTARRMVKRVTGFVFLNETLKSRAAKWIPEEKQIVIPNTIEESVQLTEDELTSKRMAREARSTRWVHEQPRALEREDSRELGVVVEVVTDLDPDRSETGLEDRQRVPGREAIRFERDAEMNLAIGSDESFRRDHRRAVVDHAGVLFVALLEANDHVDG